MYTEEMIILLVRSLILVYCFIFDGVMGGSAGMVATRVMCRCTNVES